MAFTQPNSTFVQAHLEAVAQVIPKYFSGLRPKLIKLKLLIKKPIVFFIVSTSWRNEKLASLHSFGLRFSLSSRDF